MGCKENPAKHQTAPTGQRPIHSYLGQGHLNGIRVLIEDDQAGLRVGGKGLTPVSLLERSMSIIIASLIIRFVTNEATYGGTT